MLPFTIVKVRIESRLTSLTVAEGIFCGRFPPYALPTLAVVGDGGLVVSSGLFAIKFEEVCVLFGDNGSNKCPAMTNVRDLCS